MHSHRIFTIIFSAHVQTFSTVQPTFLLPPSIAETPQQWPWSMPVITKFPQLLQNGTSSCLGYGPCSLQPDPSSVSTQPPHLSNETELVANQSSLEESMQLPDASENEPTELLCLESAVTKGQATYPELFFLKKDYNRKVILEVTPKRMHHVSGSGLISVARITFNQVEPSGFTYDLQVLFSSIETGSVANLDEFMSVCSKLSTDAQYKFCPGLNEKFYYDTFFATIRYHINSVRIWEKPFNRIDSKNCSMWHQLSKNQSKEEKKSLEVLCGSCKRLCTNLEYRKRQTDVSPARKVARQQSSSHFKLKYLSPLSTAARKKAAQKERSADKAKLAKHEELDVPLDDDQSDELCDVIKRIEETCPNELDKIFQEGDDRAVGDLVRNSWEADKLNGKKSFFKDQHKNGKFGDFFVDFC